MNKAMMETLWKSIEYHTDLLCEVMEREQPDPVLVLLFVDDIRDLLKKVVKEVKQ